MESYLRLLKFIGPYRFILILAVVIMLISAFFDIGQISMIVPFADKVLTNKKIVIDRPLPEFVSVIIDNINQSEPLNLLYIMSGVLIILFLFKGIFQFFQSYLMSDIGQRVVRDVRLKLYEKLQDLSLDYFSKKRGGELISRITHDVKLIENAASYGLTDLVYQSFQVVFFTFFIFYINWKLALVSFVILPLISGPMVFVGKVIKRLSLRSQEKMADINSLLVETISGVRIVKAFCMEKGEISKFKAHNWIYYKLMMKSIKRVLLLSPFTEFIGVFGAVFVLLIAGRDVIEGRMSFGVFGFFMGCLLSMVKPFKKLSQVHNLNQQAIAASDRIYEVLSAVSSVQETAAARDLGRFKDYIKFENVDFCYEQAPVLKDINLTVDCGQTLAIVGPSGAGKSTLVDLLARFYDPVRGRVMVDGNNIKEVTIKSLRSQIGIVTQETILFNDSVGGNISYGDTGISLEKIIEAAKKAQAHDFIEKLPKKYDTFIGDRGYKLSGGERQRLAIARALLKNPPILILDEATSQLDSASENLVQEALERLMAGRTVFVIAHRLSTVRNADKVVVLENGRIVQMGSHRELIEQQGIYRFLYNMQQSLPA